jgi:hypothetical protein
VNKRLWLLGWLIGAPWVLAQAATPLPHEGTVYRCGPRVYSQAPCPGGTPVAHRDPRSPDDVARAEANLQAQQIEGQRLRESQERIAQTERAAAAVIGAAASEPEGAERPADAREAQSKRKSTRPWAQRARPASRPAGRFGLPPEGAASGPQGLAPIIPARR